MLKVIRNIVASITIVKSGLKEIIIINTAVTVIIEEKTMKEVALFVANKLAPLDGVLSTATHFVLKKYKDHGTVLEIPEDDERMLVTP